MRVQRDESLIQSDGPQVWYRDGGAWFTRSASSGAQVRRLYRIKTTSDTVVPVSSSMGKLTLG